MKQIFIFILLCLSAPFSAAEIIYKTIDKHGNVIYSDQFTDDAETVDIGEPIIIRGPNVSKDVGEEAKQEKQAVEVGYTSIAIESPTPNAMIRNNAGMVSVTVRVEPKLQSGDTVAIAVDGRIVTSGTGMQHTLSNVDRGTHTLIAKITNAAGQVAIRSSPVQFHLFRYHKSAN